MRQIKITCLAIFMSRRALLGKREPIEKLKN
jgi:hypothetical protein